MESKACHPEKCRPPKLQYFCQTSLEEVIEVPDCLPTIEHIVSSVADYEVISLKVIKTMAGLSCEGQYLSGKKLAAEIKLKQKILYVAKEKVQSVHVLEHECYQSCYIVIPCLFEGTDPEFLLKQKMLRFKIEIEDVFIKCIGKRKIFENLSILAIVDFKPTYELCYCLHTCKSSHIHISYADGTRAVRLTPGEDLKNERPLWSPLGGEIAYLSERKGQKIFNVYSLKTNINKAFTFPSGFCFIGSYSWFYSGKKLAFTGVNSGTRDIFTISLDNMELKQLTFGNDKCESYKPKVSCSSNIAFIRALSGEADLCIMDENGLNLIQLTSCGGVRNFDWSPDGKSIVYLCNKQGSPDQLRITHPEDENDGEICLDDTISGIRKVKFAPDGKSFAFIGNLNGYDSIFIYDLFSEALEKLTKENKDEISDLVWSADSDKIYFSSSDTRCMSLNVIRLDELEKFQLIKATASKIELGYRGRIC